MFDQQPTLELLFEQLGLDASQEAIDQFIETHQLTMDVALHHAPFWTQAQHDFLISHWKKDDDWAMVVDILNEQLHTEYQPHK
ncbi:DUF2789 family protein [Acinetobacter sp. ANC 5414]|uniref:DUF2789 family protein n=1 Tax=Acinetobacter sp. ANC 5414 TaxID=2731251 RepID=UPI00148FA642|nr:DUF2789 family protein [Acinetobacter sp. ANC 5414]NNH02196.1 DUF2789 family protein [Acinetobacter sp. ANC 5414]